MGKRSQEGCIKVERKKKMKSVSAPETPEASKENATCCTEVVGIGSTAAAQGYCIVSSEKRFGLLSTFLKKNLSKKIIVIFSSCNSVTFHSEILNSLGIPSISISEKQDQQRISTVLQEFGKGVLLSTDAVVSGRNLPAVDWLVQFDPPEDVEKYLQRVTRECSRGLLFLLPEEIGFLVYLQTKVSLMEYEFRDNRIPNMQAQLEKLVEKNYRLYRLALDAYSSYISAYSSHVMKDAFNIRKLNLQAASASFGIKCPPKVKGC